MAYTKRFVKEPSKRTPWIIMESGKIFIMGRSIPDNPGEFYTPVYEYVCDYVKNYSGKSKFEFGFEYINTTSTKWIFSILRELSELKDVTENARVIWYYEHGDEDMCELGFILRSLIECPFLVVEVSEMNRSRYEMILSARDLEP
jgi:hypothetical protein